METISIKYNATKPFKGHISPIHVMTSLHACIVTTWGTCNIHVMKSCILHVLHTFVWLAFGNSTSYSIHMCATCYLTNKLVHAGGLVLHLSRHRMKCSNPRRTSWVDELCKQTLWGCCCRHKTETPARRLLNPLQKCIFHKAIYKLLLSRKAR